MEDLDSMFEVSEQSYQETAAANAADSLDLVYGIDDDGDASVRNQLRDSVDRAEEEKRGE